MPDITHSVEDGGAEEILRNQMNGGEPEGDAYLDSNFIGDVTMQNDLTVAGTIRANLVVAPPLNTMQSEIDSLEEDVESLESRVEVLEAGGSGGGGGGGGLPPDWPDDADDRYLRKDTADTAQGKVTFQAGLESNGLAQFNAGANVTGNLDATGRVQGSTLIGTTTVRSNGTMQAAGDITSTSGNISAPQGNVSGQNVTATNNVTGAHIIGTQDITSQGDITAAGTISAPNAEFTQAVIDTLTSQEITTDYLTVLKSAHFFELVIDQLRAQKGALLITCGQCQAYAVEAVTNNSVVDGWYVYYRADGDEEPEEGEPRVESIHQSFVIGDQAICQRFGEAHVGQVSEVSTAYYWRLVTNVSQTPVTKFKVSHEDIDEDGHIYHWIYLTNQPNAHDGGTEPAKGDDIVQLGYRQGVGGQALSDKDLKARQSAIIISAYSTPDQGQGGTPALVPPSLAFYNGIKTFELTPYRGTYIDATGSYFRGTFVTASGTVIGDDIEVNVETWRILPTPNVITNDTESITVKLLHFDGATSSLLSTLPEGKRLYVDGVDSEITEGSTMTIGNISYQDYTLTLVNAANDNIVYDSCPVNTFDVSGGNGQNGDTAEFVYIKLLISSETPTLPSNGQPWESTTKHGWSKTMPSAQSGYYIWMASRTITYYDASNVPNYNNWTGPIRITGEKGEDGNGIKNIFSRSATALNVAPVFTNGYPDSPSGGSATSNAATGSRVWFDDPISPSEDGDVYISQSVSSSGSGSSKVWNNWSVPALWSKYNATAAPGESWSLLALDEAFKVEIANANNYESITGALRTSLRYGVAHVVGDAITYESLSGYTLELKSDNTIGKNSVTVSGSNSSNTGTFNGIPYIKYENDNFLAVVKEDATSTQMPSTDYHYLMANDYTDCLPTKLVVVLQRGSLVLDIREVNLIFTPSHIFAVTEAALNSVYQGLSGNTSGSYVTGFSQIRQNWESIRLGVSNLERIEGGTQAPSDSDTEEFVFYRKNQFVTPQKPTSAVAQTSAVSDEWTHYRVTPSLTNNNKYVYFSRRSRVSASSSWGLWSAARIYRIYGSSDYYINNAQIQIKADEILNTVSQNYASTTSVSTISQKADAISLKVDQQTKVSENYIRHASLANLEWIDQEWTRSPENVDSYITNHYWRYVNQTCPTGLDGGTGVKCAMLSSMISVASGGLSSSVIVDEAVSITSGQTYTFSCWVKRSTYYNSTTARSNIGLRCGGVTSFVAESYNSSGVLDSGTADSSVVKIVNQATSNQMQFGIKDQDWHLILIKFTAATASPRVGIMIWGSATNSAEFLVSKPCLRQGDGTSSGSATYRTFVASSTNKMPDYALTSTTSVGNWRVITSLTISQGSTLQYIKGVQDPITPFIADRLWNTEYYTNAIHMAGSVRALQYITTTTDYGKPYSSQMNLTQSIPATMAAQLVGQDLVFSAYIKRVKKWKGSMCYNGSVVSPPDIALTLPSGATNMVAAAEDGSGITAAAESSNYLGRYTLANNDDGSWHRVWISFRIPSSSAFTIGFRVNITSSIGDDWAVTRPMLEIGTAPSGWVDSTGDSVAGALKTTGIDIEVGKITLNADNVEVANDLTIGGNTRVGGFIYNLQETTAPVKVHRCYNPLDYGNIDYKALTGSGGLPAPYLTNNLLFPECGSSILITDAVASVFGAQTSMLNKININLPFYHPYYLPGGIQTMDNMYNLCSSYAGMSGYSSLGDVPEITDAATAALMCTKFLVEQIHNGGDICRKYLGSTVTIENRMTGISSDTRYICVYGVKGLATTEATRSVGYGTAKKWFSFEPWNRNTICWDLRDYTSSSTHADKRWITDGCVPRDDEAARVIDRVRYSLADYYTGLVTGTSTVGTTRYYMNDSIWVQAAQCYGNDSSILYDDTFRKGIGLYGYVNNIQMPFAVPIGYFCRLRLVYENSPWGNVSGGNGIFYWVVEAFGEL